jgi:hypothetical protein
MKVYVCYSDYSGYYEGCTEPEIVFKDEEKAKAWVALFSPSERTYKTMEVSK